MSEPPCTGPALGSQQGLLGRRTLLGSQFILLTGKEEHVPASAWECGTLRGVVWETVGGDQRSFQVVG